MKRAILVLLVLSSIGIAGGILTCLPSSTQEQKLPPPQAFSVTASFDKPKYFLGENVLLHFTVANTGSKPFSIEAGGDYRGSPRALRFKVTAITDGKPVSDPHPNPMCFGGLGGKQDIPVSGKWEDSLALLQYCHISKPGHYRLTVSHDLGWSGKPPEAKAEVDFVMPTPAEARKVVESQLKLKETYGTMGQRKADYADLSVLQQPVYLPILVDVVKTGAPEAKCLKAISGIGSIPTQESTKALIDIAQSNKSPAVAKLALQVLNGRLPDPELEGKLGTRNVFFDGHVEERKFLVKQAWSPNFAAPVRQLGLKFIKKGDTESVQIGAFILECVGDEKSVHELVAALDQAIVKARTMKPEGYYPRPRGALLELQRAADMLSANPKFVPSDPKTPGEDVMFMSAMRTDAKFRPQNWEAKYRSFFKSDMPYVREMAVVTLPEKVPDDLEKSCIAIVNDKNSDAQLAACERAGKSKNPAYRDAVFQALSKADDEWLLRSAVSAADAHGGTLEILQLLAGRLDQNPALISVLFSTLEERTINASGYGTAIGSSGKTPDAKDGAAMKKAWLEFIKDNQEVFKKGQKISVPDPRIKSGLLPPSYAFTLVNGKQWIPK